MIMEDMDGMMAIMKMDTEDVVMYPHIHMKKGMNMDMGMNIELDIVVDIVELDVVPDEYTMDIDQVV